MEVSSESEQSSSDLKSQHGAKSSEVAPCEEVQSSRQPRTTEEGEVVVQAQVINAWHHKVLQVLSVLLTMLALAAFSFSLVFKLTEAKILFRHPIVQLVNIVFASMNVGATSAVICIFVLNALRTKFADLKWPRRKTVIALVALAQLVVQFINSVFFLVPNVQSHAKQCSWFHSIQFISATVRWSCWNTYFLLMTIHTHNICPLLDKKGKFRRNHKGPLIIMDAAWWIHLPKFVYWACFEFCIIFLAAKEHYDYKIKTVGRRVRNCLDRNYACVPGDTYKVLTSLWVVFIFIYVCMIQTYIMQARRRLLLGRYNEFLTIHLMVLRQRKQVWYITVIGVIIVPILWYVRWFRCNNYFVAWLGLLPLQVIVTAVTCMNAYYFMPLPPGKALVQQAWLREFVWNEASYKQAKLDRSAGHEEEVAKQLDKEPMFCFETAIKLAMWSEIVYSYGIQFANNKGPVDAASAGCWPCMNLKPIRQSILKESLPDHIAIKMEEPSLRSESSFRPRLTKSQEQLSMLTHEELMRTAMAMYDLEHSEVMAEDVLQTRALLAWSGSALVVAFRGTATMTNVVADAKAWRSPHPPTRGTWILGRQPLVHQGFLQTWTVNGFNKKIVRRIREIFEQRTVSAEDFTVRLTGHSLGGTLAGLAALELQREEKVPNLHLYVYGTPRIGNHQFCRELDALVPEHWNLINDRDIVPHAGKFYVLFKRGGQRVLLNQVGDVRVRPSVLERSIYKSGYSVKQHLMASYVSSLFSVCMAQCMQFKCEPGGRQGVETLAQSETIQTYFSTIGLDLRGAVMGQKDVLLPTLRRKHSQFSWWGDNFLQTIFSALEDFVPGLEEESGLGALLRGERHGSQAAAAAVNEDDRQEAPEQLLNRISAGGTSLMAVDRQQLLQSVGIDGAQHLPPAGQVTGHDIA